MKKWEKKRNPISLFIYNFYIYILIIIIPFIFIKFYNNLNILSFDKI